MRLGVLSQPHHPALRQIMERLQAYAEEFGAELVLAADLLASSGGEGPALEEAIGEVDFLLTLGGDGTLLRGAVVDRQLKTSSWSTMAKVEVGEPSMDALPLAEPPFELVA